MEVQTNRGEDVDSTMETLTTRRVYLAEGVPLPRKAVYKGNRFIEVIPEESILTHELQGTVFKAMARTGVEGSVRPVGDGYDDGLRGIVEVHVPSVGDPYRKVSYGSWLRVDSPANAVYLMPGAIQHVRGVPVFVPCPIHPERFGGQCGEIIASWLSQLNDIWHSHVLPWQDDWSNPEVVPTELQITRMCKIARRKQSEIAEGVYQDSARTNWDLIVALCYGVDQVHTANTYRRLDLRRKLINAMDKRRT